jgi:CheY-like chemotaxis protein
MSPRPRFPLWKGTAVLVVEDEPDSRDVLRQILRSLGVEPLLARDGREGLDVLARRRPAAILCDLLMPGMDGFAFLRTVRREPAFAAIPVVAVTALGGPDDLHRTWSAGFDGHLTKPVDYDTLAALLDRVLGALLRPEESEEA